MAEQQPKPHTSVHAADPRPRRHSGWLIAIRYGIPAAMIAGGIVLALVGSGDQGIEGFAMAVGGGLSVFLLNALYRIGVQGEAERDLEDAARAYYAEHGEWPDEGETSH